MSRHGSPTPGLKCPSYGSPPRAGSLSRLRSAPQALGKLARDRRRCPLELPSWKHRVVGALQPQRPRLLKATDDCIAYSSLAPARPGRKKLCCKPWYLDITQPLSTAEPSQPELQLTGVATTVARQTGVVCRIGSLLLNIQGPYWSQFHQGGL
eukprot:3665446-Pleurochrysis_carterae.AAC.1